AKPRIRSARHRFAHVRPRRVPEPEVDPIPAEEKGSATGPAWISRRHRSYNPGVAHFSLLLLTRWVRFSTPDQHEAGRTKWLLRYPAGESPTVGRMLVLGFALFSWLDLLPMR